MSFSPAAWATTIVSQAGYAGLVPTLFINSAGIPIPSEVILPLLGALARQGRFNLAVVILVATLAQAAGAQLAYELGRGVGVPLIRRYGRYVLLSERELSAATAWFSRFGGWATLLGRMLPFIRSYVGYPAGAAQMVRPRFMVTNLIGTTVWTGLLMGLGYGLGGQVQAIDHFFQRFALVIILLLLVAVVLWYGKRRRHRS